MAIMNFGQAPYSSQQLVYIDLSQFIIPSTAEQPPVVYIPPTLGEIIFGGLMLLAAGYVGYKIFFQPQKSKRRCSQCGRPSHTAASCPFVGRRHRFSSAIEKTGWCECCSDWFPNTQLHHWGGRADDSKSKEMCIECHVHCGHNGHTRNFAINPRYCRLAA
jgi:hypothetical protein